MTTKQEDNARQMPKGGRKGGSVFPRVSLSDAIAYARKLVSKTHASAQPQDVIFSGVVGAKGGLGAVRMSALKQYGFLKGNKKSSFSAEDLAKKIASAPPEEHIPLYRQAILKPTVFKKLFDTFHGDKVSKAKLKQRVADLKVHPDETANCVELYVSGMTTAELVTVEGDQVNHVASSDFVAESAASLGGDAGPDAANEGTVVEAATEAPQTGGEEVAAAGAKDSEKGAKGHSAESSAQSGPRAVFNVNVTLDSSLDIEKLQKQLEVLKRFGAI